MSELTLWNMYNNNTLYSGVGQQPPLSPQAQLPHPQASSSGPQSEALDLGHRSSSVSSSPVNVSNESKWFVYCAERYLLNGRLSDMCDHNAKVASEGGRNDISTIWSIIKALYDNPLTNIPKTTPAIKEDILNLTQMTLGDPIEQNNTNHDNEVKSFQGDGLGGISGGDDETKTDETPENHNHLGNIPPGYRKPLNGYKRTLKSDLICF